MVVQGGEGLLYLGISLGPGGQLFDNVDEGGRVVLPEMGPWWREELIGLDVDGLPVGVADHVLVHRLELVANHL